VRERTDRTKLSEVEARIVELAQTLNGREPLADFITRINPKLAPPPHVRPLVAAIERARHRPIRLCLSMPPRHGKTTTILHGFAWWLANAPSDTCAYASYNDDISRSKSRIARQIAGEAGVILADDAKNLREWRTQFGGGLLFGGVGSGLTGQGVSGLMVVDDPFKDRAEAESPTYRAAKWDWFNSVVFTRLEGASVIVVHTRWNTDDLIGRLAKMDGGPWQVINMPAIDPDGRALWPERFSADALREIEKQIGDYDFAALYQGRPRPRGAAVFGAAHYYDPAAPGWRDQIAGCRIVIAVDPAASASTASDYSVAAALAVKGHGADARGWILGILRQQSTIPQFVADLRAFRAMHWNAPVYVEAVGGFKAIPQLLKDQGIEANEAPIHGDKFQRAQGAAAAWNQGRLLVPLGAPWLPSFLDEVQSFTGVRDKHDDQVDAISHAWNTIAAGPMPITRGARAQPRRWR